MKLLISTEAPHQWAKLDKKGMAVDKGELNDESFLSMVPKGITSIIGVLPGELVTLHSVEVPTNRYANMLSAVPYALEEKLSEDIDNLHFSVLDWKAGQAAEVAVISKAALDKTLERFGEAGLTLDSLIPDYALLPIHAESNVMVAQVDTERYIVKQGPYQAAIMDQFALEYWWQEVDKSQSFTVSQRELANEMKENGGEQVSLWEIGSDFSGWLEHAPLPDTHRFSLLREGYEPEHLKPNNNVLNWAVGIAACALLLLGGSNWLELNNLKTQHQANEDEIKSLFAQAFPEQEYLDQPRRQISSLLSIDDSGDVDEKFQYLLQVVSKIVPENNALFGEINYRNSALQVGVLAPSFATLEKMTTQIDQTDGVRAALVSSGSEADKVKGQIKLIVSDS